MKPNHLSTGRFCLSSSVWYKLLSPDIQTTQYHCVCYKCLHVTKTCYGSIYYLFSGYYKYIVKNKCIWPDFKHFKFEKYNFNSLRICRHKSLGSCLWPIIKWISGILRYYEHDYSFTKYKMFMNVSSNCVECKRRKEKVMHLIYLFHVGRNKSTESLCNVSKNMRTIEYSAYVKWVSTIIKFIT